ncbi:hypothetical protein SGLAD_v1c05470 [Spiroplasma gladiatoris]|uniref:Uncharacterized protein n=1 Tax=Spiroplasma gladiatoris TaxID=2143 RepID=A0A4P7AJB0_9MOLU|nr:hypothetical protein [Spiroplasma gladiatoris]QBQ07746.1 hypothetical protein SGLAD_v1c05470 [Spiroplasma gladiatoris]
MSFLIKLFITFGFFLSNSLSLSNKNIYEINNVNTNDNYKFNEFLTNDKIISKNDSNTQITSKLMFYGRVLKYFYTKNVVGINENIYTNLTKHLTYNQSIVYNQNNNFIDKKAELSFYKALFLQNLIGSTINLSEYGSKNDREFFAEAFAKWLLTPDEYKNKSWELTNYFFINFLPNLINSGQTNLNNLNIKLDNLFLKNQSIPKYNLNAKINNQNKLNLNYQDENIGWLSKINNNSYTEGCISNFLEQSSMLVFDNNKINIFEFYKNNLSNWMNDTYTKASEISIKSFYEFSTNHYQNFFELNQNLITASKNKNNFSQVNFENIFDLIDKNYTNVFNAYNWKKQYTLELKQAVLMIYNYLFSLIYNSKWVENILSSFIISSDSKLKNSSKSVLGYTGTELYIDDQKFSIKSSYIVLKLNSFIEIKESNNYQTQWFSSPSWYSVLIHEYGHALDGFGGRINEFREMNDAINKKYDYYYEGNKIGYDFDYNNFLNIFLWFFFYSLTLVLIVVVTGLNIKYNLLKKKLNLIQK